MAMFDLSFDIANTYEGMAWVFDLIILAAVLTMIYEAAGKRLHKQTHEQKGVGKVESVLGIATAFLLTVWLQKNNTNLLTIAGPIITMGILLLGAWFYKRLNLQGEHNTIIGLATTLVLITLGISVVLGTTLSSALPQEMRFIMGVIQIGAVVWVFFMIFGKFITGIHQWKQNKNAQNTTPTQTTSTTPTNIALTLGTGESKKDQKKQGAEKPEETNNEQETRTLTPPLINTETHSALSEIQTTNKGEKEIQSFIRGIVQKLQQLMAKRT